MPGITPPTTFNFPKPDPKITKYLKYAALGIPLAHAIHKNMPSTAGFIPMPIPNVRPPPPTNRSKSQTGNSTRQLTQKETLIVKTIDGMLAGLTGVTMTYPLDLSKTRLQNQVTKTGELVKYKNLPDTVIKVFRYEGLKGAYAGYLGNASVLMFEAAFKLVANDMIRKKLTDKKTGKITVLNECLTGAFTGVLQSISITPRELLKIKGQEAFTRGEKFSLAKSVKEIYLKGGIKGFYQGWAATVARDVPYAVVYFPMYAHLKDSDLFHNGREFKYNFLAGFLSGMAAAGVSCPFDVIKTRLQNQPAGLKNKLSWMGCAKNAWKTEGQYRAFFKGVVPRMMCIGSLFATAQAFYELQFGLYIYDAVQG